MSAPPASSLRARSLPLRSAPSVSAEIGEQLREDFRKRLAVPPHQGIGRCLWQIDAARKCAFAHQLRTRSSLIDQGELHGEHSGGFAFGPEIAVKLDD